MHYAQCGVEWTRKSGDYKYTHDLCFSMHHVYVIYQTMCGMHIVSFLFSPSIETSLPNILTELGAIIKLFSLLNSATVTRSDIGQYQTECLVCQKGAINLRRWHSYFKSPPMELWMAWHVITSSLLFGHWRLRTFQISLPIALWSRGLVCPPKRAHTITDIRIEQFGPGQRNKLNECRPFEFLAQFDKTG